MQQLIPVHTIITNIKGAISITKGTVLVHDELFTQAEESIKAKYANLVITDEKEFAKERAHLRRFAKTLKDYYKTLESEILSDLRNNVYQKINNLSAVAEQMANEIADKESVFIIEKQEYALSKVQDYIESLIDSGYLIDRGQIEIKPFYKNYSHGAFLRAKKDIDEQIVQLKIEQEKHIIEKQTEAKQSEQEAKNYGYIINHINGINKEFSLNIDASTFYELRKMHLSDALKEIDQYADFLKSNNKGESDKQSINNAKDDTEIDSDVLELLKAAQYILYTQHSLTIEPLEKAVAVLEKQKNN